MPFPIESFVAFVSNAPLAATPGPSDSLALIQSGLLKQLKANSIPLLATVPGVTINQSVYNADLTVQAILVNRSPASPTTINLVSNPGANRPMLIKDIAGNAGGGNTISIGNAIIDGVAGAIITTNYGYLRLLSTGVGNEWAVVT